MAVMAGKHKSYKVDFFVATLGGQRANTAFADLLDSATNGYTEALPLEVGEDERFQVRSIERINRGNVIKGVFGRCRFGESPIQGNATGEEADVELKPGHGLVAKNHFLYFRARNLLVYQRNVDGSHVAKFQRYANLAGTKGIAFEPLLTTDAYKRLIEGGAAKSVEFSFQQPRDPSLYQDLFTSDAVKLLKSVNGLNCRMKFTVGRTSRRLLGRVKDAAIVLAKSGLANVAKIRLEEDTEPIDLIADRIIETISVPIQLNGRPHASDIYAALQLAETARAADIRVFFGT